MLIVWNHDRYIKLFIYYHFKPIGFGDDPILLYHPTPFRLLVIFVWKKDDHPRQIDTLKHCSSNQWESCKNLLYWFWVFCIQEFGQYVYKEWEKTTTEKIHEARGDKSVMLPVFCPTSSTTLLTNIITITHNHNTAPRPCRLNLEAYTMATLFGGKWFFCGMIYWILSRFSKHYFRNRQDKPYHRPLF